MSKWKKTGTFYGKKKKNGERRINGVYMENTEDGRVGAVLNPSGKGAKYAAELKHGKRYTNRGEEKCGKDGKPQSLTKQQRAYRAGYLDARKDNAKAFNSKKRGKKN